MKKFFVYFILVIMIVNAGVFHETASMGAVLPEEPYCDIRLLAKVDNVNTFEARNTYTVTLQAAARNGAVIQNEWSVHFAYDTSVFSLLTVDGSQTLDEVLDREGLVMDPNADYISITSPVFIEVVPNGASQIKSRLSGNNQTVFLALEGNLHSETNFFECKIRFAFQPGKTVIDADEDSIRLMQRAEQVQSYGDQNSISFNEDGYQYGEISGESDGLSVSAFEYDNIWAESVIVKSSHPNVYVNLTEEKLYCDLNIVAYSVNAGRTWEINDIPKDKAFTDLFDTDLKLLLATELDFRGKPTGTFIAFPLIKKRMKITADSSGNSITVNLSNNDYSPIWVPEKIGIWYGEETWNFTKRGTTAPVENTFIMAKSADGETPDAGEPWRCIRNGICAVKIGKPDTKEQYILCLPAVGDGSAENPYTAASKSIRIKPKTMIEESYYRIDFRRNYIKMKKGDVFTIGDGAIQQYTGTPLFILEIPVGTIISIWKAATGKKPPSEKYEITVP